MRKIVLRSSFVWAFFSFAAMADGYYVKKSTWVDTLKTSRSNYIKALKKGEISPLTIGSWYTTGLFKNKSRSAVLFPETDGVNLTDKGADGKALWQKAGFEDGTVNSLGFDGQAVTYLYRTIDADADVSKAVSLGSDDGIKIWLNGRVIHDNPARRGVRPGSDRITFDLKKGRNELLLKIDNEGGGGYGFYYEMKNEANDIIRQVKADFPENAQTFGRDISSAELKSWLKGDKSGQIEHAWQNKVNEQIGQLSGGITAEGALERIAQALLLEEQLLIVKRQMALFNPEALSRSIKYLTRRYRKTYPNGKAYMERLKAYTAVVDSVKSGLAENNLEAFTKASEMLAFQRKAMLDNPLLDFDKLLVTKRKSEGTYGLSWNWQGNTSIPNYRGLNNEIVTISLKDQEAVPETLIRNHNESGKGYLGDTTLHWNGKRFLYSGLGENGRFQIFEADVATGETRQVTKGIHKDVESYDACYLPNGKILFNSTSGFHGVPCVGGVDYVGNLHVMDSDGSNIRRLCFDQDNNWYPIVKEDGQIMYLRWEYTDSAHYFSRVLMTMNPDGTGQKSMYGSNSYWPNTLFYARPIPGSNSKFVAIVSGHHGVRKEGELIIFDAKKGTKGNQGAIQKIPGYGKPVEEKVLDNYARDVWPRFLYPFPLSDKYFITTMRMKGEKSHGVYLVDAFDNMTLIKKIPGYSLLEPRPLRKVKTPPIIPDRVRLDKKEGTLFIADIYQGPGLRGVPRGEVKGVRVFQYEYSYRNGGGHYVIGMDGPWDVRRLLGTADVHADGSCMFKVPANRPIAIQPIDKDGKAMQLFRSWLVVMPGETLSCVGCHESPNQAAPTRHSVAQKNPPQNLKPFYGPVRGFSFDREVQPVLDRKCVGCHDGTAKKVPNFSRKAGKFMHTNFSVSYWNLMKYVRRNGPEGDYNVLTPLEFHANTSRLVQLLEKDHYNVKLTREEWDRIITWMDINVPYHGTWREATDIRDNFQERRYELKKLYANVDEDIETVSFNKNSPVPDFEAPEYQAPEKVVMPKVDGWPFTRADAAGKQSGISCGNIVNLTFTDGSSDFISFSRIPAGKFIKGDKDGYKDEKPKAVEIEKGFLMATTEVTLEEFRKFDPTHKNGYYDMHYKDQVKPGYDMDADKNAPVIRVSWEQAMAYCQWLSKKLGRKVTLPTENQWEWACRAGTDTPLFYGDLDTDFGKFANLADVSLKKLAVRGVNPQPIRNPDAYWDWELKDERFDDNYLHLAPVASYKTNAWDLYDMHGNVAEWTRDAYSGTDERKVVRGGSWYDRPKRARSAYRLPFPKWQKVFNVGFRVIVED